MSPEDWEKKLSDLGLPEEPVPEAEKAAEAGVELVPAEAAVENYAAIAKRLEEEDPRNRFGGFPNTFNGLTALVETLKAEWTEGGVPPENARIAVHASCVNGNDCVAVSRQGGNEIYHYNTQMIRGYTRGKLVSHLRSKGVRFVEK